MKNAFLLLFHVCFCIVIFKIAIENVNYCFFHILTVILLLFWTVNKVEELYE